MWMSLTCANTNPAPPPPSPSIDETPSLFDGWGLAQSGHDPAAGLSGVDDVVDLEDGGGVERLALVVGGLDEMVEQRPGIIGGFELLAEAEPYRALQAHPAEFPGRPGHREQRNLEAAAGHGLRTQSVRLAQDDHAHGHP